MDSSHRVNILIQTFPGLALPPTVSFSLSSETTTATLLNRIATLLPASLSTHLTLTTTSNHAILPSTVPLSALLPAPSNHAPLLLPLTLSAPLLGGKGGFGSQLRAAGGRMSSRKRKNALASDPNAGIGSNRNLDGRRLRTITEAKNLAGYLATREEVARKEKEEKRRRWEAVVEKAETREDEIRRGMAGGMITGGKGKGLSEEWLEEREDAGERTREAVRKAMAGGAGEWRDNLAGRKDGEGNCGGVSPNASGSGASRDPSEEDSEDEQTMDLDEDEIKTLEREAADGDVDATWVLTNRARKPSTRKVETRTYIGFDQDDEFMSSSEDDEDDAIRLADKGKQTMTA